MITIQPASNEACRRLDATPEPAAGPMADPTVLDLIKRLADFVDASPLEGALTLATEARAYLATPEPAAGPTDEELLGLDELRDAWNAQADAANSWDELGLDEIVCFAQKHALACWGHQPPQPIPLDDPPGPCPEPAAGPTEVATLIPWLLDAAIRAADGGASHAAGQLTLAAQLLGECYELNELD